MSLPLPEELVQLVDELREKCGVEPQITELGTANSRRWRVEIQNDRVRMNVDYRAASRGRIVWLRSGLWVDEQRVPLAKNVNDFLSIWKNPDDRRGPLGTAEPLLPEVDPETAPPIVRHTYAQFARQLAPGTVRISNLNRRWVVSVSNDRIEMRWNFRRTKEGIVLDQPSVQLIIDGHDESARADGDISKALALMSAPLGGPETSQSEGKTSSGTGFGSVDIRRHSVIRN